MSKLCCVIGRLIRHLFRNLEEAIAGLALVTILISQSLQIVFRYVLQAPLTNTEELSRLLFIWLVFTGALVVSKRGAHLSIDVLVSILPPRFRAFVMWLNRIVILVFLVVLTVYGTRLVSLAGRVRTPALNAPVSVMYVPVLLFAVFSIVQMVRETIASFRASSRGSTESVAASRGSTIQGQ